MRAFLVRFNTLGIIIVALIAIFMFGENVKDNVLELRRCHSVQKDLESKKSSNETQTKPLSDEEMDKKFGAPTIQDINAAIAVREKDIEDYGKYLKQQGFSNDYVRGYRGCLNTELKGRLRPPGDLSNYSDADLEKIASGAFDPNKYLMEKTGCSDNVLSALKEARNKNLIYGLVMIFGVLFLSATASWLFGAGFKIHFGSGK